MASTRTPSTRNDFAGDKAKLSFLQGTTVAIYFSIALASVPLTATQLKELRLTKLLKFSISLEHRNARQCPYYWNLFASIENVPEEDKLVFPPRLSSSGS